MGRRSFAVKSVEQLKKMVNHALNLCDTCEGCALNTEVGVLQEKAWKDHRQGVKAITYRCNSFKPDITKSRIAPPIGD